MSTDSKPLGEATYVATETDKAWLQNERRKLYARSRQYPDYNFRKLWGLVTDPRNLRTALQRVSRNRGRRTAGVDGITVRRVLREGTERFLDALRADLRSGAYRPSPVRRVFIPKPGQPGKHRPLGVPTVKDRVVQAAVKNILEPIFEADFYPTSYGFRPGKSVHGALEHLRMLLRPSTTERRLPYQWAIEGDIKGCFDNIDHHALMVRVRRRIGDVKMNRLVLAFLRSGVLSEAQFLRTEAGTPQGGILSPLLANIALCAIDERYELHVWPRRTPTLRTEAAEIERRASGRRAYDRHCGRPIFFPIRYADDFIILVDARGDRAIEHGRIIAENEKVALAKQLKEGLGLELSESKTLVTSVTQPMRFLGHHVRVRRHPCRGCMVSTAVIPKERSQRLRKSIKELFRRETTGQSLGDRLHHLNPLLRGWANFYRHAWGAKTVFDGLDHYVWWTIFRWLRKKHPHATAVALMARHGGWKRGVRGAVWRSGDITLYRMARTRVQRYRLNWQRRPDFASTSMESPVHSERCTPGLGRGAWKPT
jgi:RNA-directed DNA polymerase